jgi:hypothetical protein
MTELNVAVRGEFDVRLLVPSRSAQCDPVFRQCDVCLLSASFLSHSLHNRLGVGEVLWGVYLTGLKVVLGIKIPDTGNLNRSRSASKMTNIFILGT